MAAALPALADDAFAEWMAMMREVARSEGHLSDLRKERDEALARLRADRHAASEVAAHPWQREPGEAGEVRNGQDLEAEIAALAARYAARIAAAEARFADLQRRARAARPGPTADD
ncbi:MAG: hypothetical protein EA400_03690 [Chromatiaceae bacterium]|nr:MAG: hypothetical protein EA400_03690 [Chromatiaceae bacterium]